MPKETETEVLETPEIEEAEDQVQEPETEEHSEEPEAPEEEETVISFGDEDEEESEEADTPTIKRLRERNREQTKRLRELDKEIAELRQSAVKPKIEVGPKPDLWEDCEGDPEKFEVALDAWKQRKAEAETETERAEEKTRRVIESYNSDLASYNERKAKLGVSDYEDAEATVVAALNMEQQAVALQAANDPAALVYALAKSPAKLAELAKIDNPWKLSAAIARLEGSVKVVTRKKAPAIDRPAKGSASVAQMSADKRLEQLEAEAEKTGDRTKVQQYKRELKAQQK
jgi:hypothetical protein